MRLLKILRSLFFDSPWRFMIVLNGDSDGDDE